VDKLRRKYRKKLDRLEKRLAREQRELADDQGEYQARKREELISAGESVIGLLGIFGRRSTTGFSRAARKRRLTSSAKADIAESQEEIESLKAETEDMRQELEEEAKAIADRWASVADEIEDHAIKPRRKDVDVEMVALAWAPYWEIGHSAAAENQARDRVPAWLQL